MYAAMCYVLFYNRNISVYASSRSQKYPLLGLRFLYLLHKYLELL